METSHIDITYLYFVLKILLWKSMNESEIEDFLQREMRTVPPSSGVDDCSDLNAIFNCRRRAEIWIFQILLGARLILETWLP